jgi:uncharacterized protein
MPNGKRNLAQPWRHPQAHLRSALAFAQAAYRRKYLASGFLLTLLLLSLLGCSILNRYIFIAKQDLPATPEKFHLPHQEIWFAARDGVELNGWFLPGAADKPLVLFFHGNAGNLSDNLDYLNLLQRDGFPVFIFDYRGYGKSEGEPLRENDLYQDARGALSYLEGMGWQHERMIYFGQSLGSAVALQMALEARPAGLVLESSFTSMKEIVKHFSPTAYYLVGWWGINLPFDNLAKINRVQTPVLLIHGDRDAVVPVEMTRQLYDRAQPPKTLLILNGGGHCDVFTRDSSAYQAAWSGYLLSIAERLALRSP